MKTQKDIVKDVNNYRDVVFDNAIKARQKYYLEDRKFYRDMRFEKFLDNRSKLHMLENILGLEKSNLQIVIYA